MSRVSLCPLNSLISLWHGFHKMLKTFCWDSVHGSMIASHNFRNLSAEHSCILLFHIPKEVYWIQIQWLGRLLKIIELYVMFMKPVWDDFCFVTWCIIILDVAIRRWPWRHAHGQQQYSKRLWHSHNDWLALTGPKCARKTFPTLLHHFRQPGLLKQGRLGPYIHAFGTKFRLYHLYASAEIYHLTRLCFSCPQLSGFGEPVSAAVSAFCSWMTEEEPDMVFCCCSPSKPVGLCILRFVFFESSCQVTKL